MAKRFRDRIRWWDVVAGLAGAAILMYAIEGGEDFTDRATSPTQLDNILGCIFIVLLLEATRRTTGWIVPVISLAFIAYAYFGPYMPPPWTHRGFDVGQLVGHLFITLEGIFGIPVDVSSSLIILFTIYGAFLQHSGAGAFFIDFSMALLGNKPNSAGRTVVLSSFLLGGPSGSGVATTVTVGAVAYPMMEKSGFEKNAAGGLLAAGGLGAIISPPVLGAAAFLIAEFLKISYLDVIAMATIPTCLYYLSLLFMVELDAKKFGAQTVDMSTKLTLWQMLRRYGFHFISLISVVIFMLWGYSPTLSVFWATVATFALSFLTRETALVPKKLVRSLADGSTSVLTAATTCATAGIIVGVVTLTGLGLKFSAIVIGYAGGSLLLTAIYTALIVWIVGLAVPVTASYIICAVIAAPAMMKLGVPDVAAHMFIFYYSVLSEVSPPTALSPFAAAAITGGDPYKTTLQAWKYTLPAFLVPFVFVLDPQGVGLLLMIPPGGSWVDIVHDHGQGGARPRRACRCGARLGAAPHHGGRTGASRAGRPLPGVPEPAGSAGRSHDRPGHQLHRDNWRGHRHRRAAKTAHATGLAKGAGGRLNNGFNIVIGRNVQMKRKGLLLSGLGARHGCVRRRGDRAAEHHRHRDRRHRRRVLSARRRHGQRAVEIRAWRAGHRACHRRLGRQPQADRLEAERGRAGDGRRRARCAQGRRQVQGQQGRSRDPDGALSEPHACGDGRGPRHREDVRPQGQARLHRFARQRHRSDGVPRHRGRRSRQGQGHAARASRRRGIPPTPSRTARSTPTSGSAVCRPRR